MMVKGEQIYITRVAWPTRAALTEHCKKLTVEHTTPKAVLCSCGDSQQWFPLAALTPSSNTDSVYLLARWCKLPKAWAVRCGAPTPRQAALTQ